MLCQAVTKLNNPCAWKAKPSCGDFCKAHKNYVKLCEPTPLKPNPTPAEPKTSKSGYMPKSQTDSWSTPNALYADLNKEFQFDKYDPCPLEENPQNNGLVEEWG